jgi:hypothetical protein
VKLATRLSLWAPEGESERLTIEGSWRASKARRPVRTLSLRIPTQPLGCARRSAALVSATSRHAAIGLEPSAELSLFDQMDGLVVRGQTPDARASS